MNILVTNDDGYDAPGIEALTTLSHSLGKVTVLAPSTPQSYVGHKVTETGPLALTEHGDGRYHLHGTPADCVRVAIHSIDHEFDWILAGVNNGANLGANLYSSGTVAAAREAALLGYKSVAISQLIAKGREIDWNLTQSRAFPVLKDLLNQNTEVAGFWNVNLPHPDHQDPCEVVHCPVDPSGMEVRFRKESSNFIYDGEFWNRPRIPSHDVFHCLDEGKITVSFIPLQFASYPP